MELIRSSNRAREWLRLNNYPYSDDIQLRISDQTFSEGGHYGIEIPVVNSFKMLQKIIEVLKSKNIPCTRFNETHGSFLLSDNEIQDMLSLCRENNYGMLFSLSPRPEYDTKASFYRTKFGLEQGRKLNNNDAITYSVEETLRLSEMGCRGIIVYDIGVLSILSDMRKIGKLPSDMIFKASSHCMVTNPLIAKIMAMIGADSVTVVHDTSFSVLQEMRRLSPKLVLDVPIDIYLAKGGFIRYNEIAEIAQIASPVMLKMGASAQSDPYIEISPSIAELRVERVARGIESLKRAKLPLELISPNSLHCCKPK